MTHPQYENRQVRLSAVYGRTIAALRAQTGMSQMAFAEMAHMKQGALARIETARTHVSLEQQFSIEAVLRDAGVIEGFAVVARFAEAAGVRLREMGTTVNLLSDKADLPFLEPQKLDAVVAAVVGQGMTQGLDTLKIHREPRRQQGDQEQPVFGWWSYGDKDRR